MRTIITALITLSLFVSCLCSSAQFKQIAESAKFEEPETGVIRLLQMKNGNTVYFHLTLKEGINLRVYDADHKQKLATSFDVGFERAKVAAKGMPTMFPNRNEENIEAIFAINNELVVILSEYEKKKTTHYRLLIDLTTGKLKEAKSFLTVPNGYVEHLTVTKDDYSDNYLVESDTEFIYYDGNHQQLFNYPITSKENKNLRLRNILVLDNDKRISFYRETGKDYQSTFFVSTSDKNGTESKNVKLNVAANMLYNSATVKYNPVSKKIFFLVHQRIETKRETSYIPHLLVIDPTTLSSEEIKSFIPNEALQTKYKEQYDTKKDYNALPVDFYVNKDGSVSIIFEEFMQQSTSSDNYTRYDTRLGKMVVVKIDKEGKFIDNFLVPKVHWNTFDFLDFNYHSVAQNTAQKLWGGNQYKSYDYVYNGKNQYLLMNDSERNNEVKNDKFVEIQSVVACDAFVYKFTPGEIFPPRTYFFNKPDKGNILAMFLVSNYDATSNNYVTLKLVKESARDKEISIVWLQPQ